MSDVEKIYAMFGPLLQHLVNASFMAGGAVCLGIMGMGVAIAARSHPSGSPSDSSNGTDTPSPNGSSPSNTDAV